MDPEKGQTNLLSPKPTRNEEGIFPFNHDDSDAVGC